MNRKDLKKKTDFNNWSISYLSEIFECGRCKKRNTIIKASSQNKNSNKYQNCCYCGNPNYINI